MATKRTALVTGASYGVGAAIALALARDGFDVAITATKLDNLAATMKALGAAGARALPLVLDLREQASIEQATADVVTTFGGLDVLVNNAGANVRRLAVEVTAQDWDAVMAVNIRGTFFPDPAGRPASHRRRQRRLHRQHRLDARACRHRRALDLRHLQGGARANDTDAGGGMGRRTAFASMPSRPAALRRPRPRARRKARIAAIWTRCSKRIPLHRLASAEEVAATVAYLVSPAAASMTGQVLVLDGGLTAA